MPFFNTPARRGCASCLHGLLPVLALALLPAFATALTYPVVDTGQSKTYNAASNIPAPALGQPFYGQDAQFSGNQPAFTLSSDGKTVADKVTQLTWMRGPNTTLAAPVSTDKKTWAAAQAWVASVNSMAYGGFSDWRLPSIKELYSLMNFKGTDPSSYSGSNTAVLTPFIDTAYFNFGYGQTSAGERIIDSQYASSDVFVVNPAETGSAKLFGLNLADGRIKGYDLAMPGGRTEKTFFVQLVRGASGYGSNHLADNGDSTVTDAATGLMWSRGDSSTGMTWPNALAWVQSMNAASYLGHADWRMPNAKELHSLVNYANAPDYNGKPAIDTTFFNSTAITNENGETDFPYYWASTTHAGYSSTGSAGGSAVYIPFGRALGWPAGASKWVDVHGAGCQRSDPKIAPPYAYATLKTMSKNGISYTGYAFGPQGDALRGLNFVRLVRDAGVSVPVQPANPGSFSGNRSGYRISKTAGGWVVTDSAGLVTPLASGATSIKFADVTVNLKMGDLSKTIAAADLKTIIELYVAFFNRIPEADGLAYWITQFKAGMTLDQMADSFYAAALQYTTLTGYSASLSATDFVGIIYKNVLGRSGSNTPPAVDVQYWANKLTAGSATKGSLLMTILATAHSYPGDALWGWVPQLLNNKASAATLFAIQQGLNYNTPTESMTQGMAIAAAVTPTGTEAAVRLMNITDTAFDLTAP